MLQRPEIGALRLDLPSRFQAHQRRGREALSPRSVFEMVAICATRTTVDVNLCRRRIEFSSMLRVSGVRMTPLPAAVARSRRLRRFRCAAFGDRRHQTSNCSARFRQRGAIATARLPLTPSSIVQKSVSAWSRRTLRLSVDARQPTGSRQHCKQRNLRQGDCGIAIIGKHEFHRSAKAPAHSRRPPPCR